MSPPSLEQLFRRYQRDADLDALAELFDRTAPEVARIASFLSSQPGHAEDLLQATYLTAIERADSFRGDDDSSRVVPWLLGILANKAKRLHREAARDVPADSRRTRSADDPTAELEHQELRSQLERTLARLPEPQRPAVSLMLLDGMSLRNQSRQEGNRRCPPANCESTPLSRANSKN